MLLPWSQILLLAPSVFSSSFRVSWRPAMGSDEQVKPFSRSKVEEQRPPAARFDVVSEDRRNIVEERGKVTKYI